MYDWPPRIGATHFTPAGTSVIVIDLNDEREWGDCVLCEKYRRLNWAVGWYCGPTRDEIGKPSTEYQGPDNIVGGMCVCRECHDSVYHNDDPHDTMMEAKAGSDE